MEPTLVNRPRTAAYRPLVAALALLAAACADEGTGPGPTPPPFAPTGAVAAFRCDADVRGATVQCESLSPEGGASAALAPDDGPASRDLKIVGGQGTYVRLASSSVTYAAGVFAFNVTVQNLATQAMATADGATRHADGVRVFFHNGPTATGGTGTVSVANATGTGTFTAAGQDYFQYGGQIGGVDQAELGGDGILSTAEVSTTKNWQLNVPGTVTNFSFVLYVAAEVPGAGSLASAAPQVTGISPATLVPGTTATLTGVNFNGTPASNTVTIGGRAAAVTGGGAGTLQVTVPCVSSGSVPVSVAAGGMKGADFGHPLQVTQRTVGVGQALVLASASDSHCNELAPAVGAARYLVSVFSVSTSPASNAPFQFSADGPGEPQETGELAGAASDRLVVPPAPSLDRHMDLARQQEADRKHAELLEANRREYVRLRAHFGTRRAEEGPRLNRNVVAGDPPLTRTFRIPNIAGGNFCNSFYVVSATRVYYDGKMAIYEDDATPNAFKASVSATMAANYQSIGDQFNADMEPIIRTHFGDILRRDAVTDNNGVLIALFTPRINTSFTGVAGYVVSCDLFPNDDAGTPAVGGPYTGTGTNGSSNFGEFFYAYQPVTDAVGFSGNTPQNWYRTIRSTFIHESKHVASYVARTANGTGNQEVGWLEEGTARHSEELWMRNAVDNVAWKANTGYGSAGNPINVYCDVRPEGWPECLTNTRRPASIMQRHFTSLYTHMFGTNGRLLSPFGATASDNASYYYAISWSLVRYAVDRYGTSDAQFLTDLTQSSTTGVTNLTARAGVSVDQLLGGWALTLAADDHPLLAGPASPDIQFPTWNMRSIYAGFNADFSSGGTFTQVYPVTPAQFSFGSFNALTITTLRGGGSLWYEISGTQTVPQLLRLETNTGALPSANLRVAVTRLQ